MPQPDGDNWIHAGALAELAEGGRRVIKVGAKQIVLFHGEKGVFACNNRCPHEGYPLKEGSLTGGCILTCNWHNWKFDLESGETLVGGDRLRRYRVRIEDGQVWLDVGDPPAAARAAAALASLRHAFGRHEYERMAREVSRLQRAGADPLEALRQAIGWSHDRLEFGTTHAQAAAPDWLALRARYAKDEATRLVPLVEILGHLAWDSLREPCYPYATEVRPYDAAALVAALEAEDEAAAIGLLRGALAEGLGFAALGRPLAEAALAHYQDFGHALIYVYKTGQLIERLGAGVGEPLLLALVRSLVYATREDLIPEFRSYGKTLAALNGGGGGGGGGGGKAAKAEDFLRLSVPKALARAAESLADPEALFEALIGAAARQLLCFDLALQDRTDGPVSRNVGWLDFTHAITFANALRVLAGRYPELWPPGLLQIACFLGRNSGWLDLDQDSARWAVTDRQGFLDRAAAGLFDHGQFEYIVACHQVKLLAAVAAETANAPEAPWVDDLLAATNRFLNSPLKRKHATRAARQAMDFVALEG